MSRGMPGRWALWPWLCLFFLYHDVAAQKLKYTCSVVNGDCDNPYEGNVYTCENTNGNCYCNQAAACICKNTNGFCACGEADQCTCGNINGDCCMQDDTTYFGYPTNGKIMYRDDGECKLSPGEVAGAVIGSIFAFLCCCCCLAWLCGVPIWCCASASKTMARPVPVGVVPPPAPVPVAYPAQSPHTVPVMAYPVQGTNTQTSAGGYGEQHNENYSQPGLSNAALAPGDFTKGEYGSVGPLKVHVTYCGG
eukprot:g65395.t1